MLLIGNFVLAETFDLSAYENDEFFLDPSLSSEEDVGQFTLVDFIPPLANYKKEEMEKFLLKANKRTWQYVVKKGESLWSISKKFKVPLAEILAFNNFNEDTILKPGDKIVLPGIEPKAKAGIARESQLAGKFVSALKEVGNLVIPVSGFNWGVRHSQNGADIAAPCGSEVYSAQDGLVVESSDGWNSGYGNYIIIRHPDYSYTLYGHLSMRVVEAGQKVKRGQLIGYVGNTGYVEGPTGCHLHFEVRGKINPLLR